MTMRPMAIGIEVVPMDALSMALPIWGQTIAGHHPDGHGQEDPQGQVSIKKRKALQVSPVCALALAGRYLSIITGCTVIIKDKRASEPAMRIPAVLL